MFFVKISMIIMVKLSTSLDCSNDRIFNRNNCAIEDEIVTNRHWGKEIHQSIDRANG